MEKKKFIWRMALCAVMLCAIWPGGVSASQLVTQTWLPGECIPQFASPLAIFGPGANAALPRVNTATNPFMTIIAKEFEQSVLPPASAGYGTSYFDTISGLTANCPAVNVKNTRLWGYEMRNSFTNKQLAPAHWPSVTLEMRRYIPTVVTYVNKFSTWNPANTTTDSIAALSSAGGLVQGLVTIDETIDWADPLGYQAANMCNMWPPMVPASTACQAIYAGPSNPPPMIVHLHGGEVHSNFDGGPLGWFTPTSERGPGYRTLFNAGPGKQVSYYPNTQEAGTLWIHDHVMGQTRTNVYSGPAAFYFLRDPFKEPANLPKGAYEIEIALQDRQFDTNSQLFWPDGSGACGSGVGSNGLPNGITGDPCFNGAPTNPTIHPYWIPEFLGDVVAANGVPWPYVNVEQKRYRFRLLAGSNARMWRLNFGSIPVWVIGSDDNYLDAPVPATTSTLPGAPNVVFIAPGERVDVIADFTGLSGNFTVTNDASAPFPVGMVPGVDQPSMANVIQFRVGPAVGADTSCNPAAGGCKRPYPMVRLADGNGNVAPGVKIDKKRQLILKEIASVDGPIMVMVNNTMYMGSMSPGVDLTVFPDGMTETPRVGSTEQWEIINLTMDAHPMHTHLVQFQILSRESYQMGMPGETKNYLADWASDFPGYAWSFANVGSDPLNMGIENPAPPPDFLTACDPGVFCPAYGPPKPYQQPNGDGALGGNRAIGPYLKGDVTPPDPWESGWKDTAKAYPGQVLRMLVRWTPTDKKVIPNWSYAGHNFFAFDPTTGPGYVWHCHIIDHEDNDMMRPYKVIH